MISTQTLNKENTLKLIYGLKTDSKIYPNKNGEISHVWLNLVSKSSGFKIWFLGYRIKNCFPNLLKMEDLYNGRKK